MKIFCTLELLSNIYMCVCLYLFFTRSEKGSFSYFVGEYISDKPMVLFRFISRTHYVGLLFFSSRPNQSVGPNLFVGCIHSGTAKQVFSLRSNGPHGRRM